MKRDERERFDELLESLLASLPARLHHLLQESPLIVEDHPSEALREELGMADDEVLCGLHSGIPLTERSIDEPPRLPDTIHIFREGIVDSAGGWEPWTDESGYSQGGEAAIVEQIRITVLHEIGHHFGLDEDDLERLGYG